MANNSNEFMQKRLQQELSKMTNHELTQAILDGHEEAKACKDEKEWRVIRDTVLAIGQELERRGLK
jgi:hypothetical protein